MKIHHGKFNDQYHLAHAGEDSPLNVDIAGTTRPVSQFYASATSPQTPTLSYYQLEYVLDGKVYIEVENQTYCAEKGDFFFINTGFFRSLYSDKKHPVKKLFVTAKGPLMDGIIKAYKLKSPVIVTKIDVEKHFKNIINILETAAYYSPEVRDKIGVEILAILQTAARQLNTVDVINKRHIAENILKFIEENLSRKFTIDELSQNFFLGKTQLIKVFKDKYGVTPIKYAQLQRIEMAKHYLTNTDEPISTLHDKLGFEDTKYFSKLFKKTTGIPPSEYRNIKLSIINYDPGVVGKFDASLRRVDINTQKKSQ